MQEPFSFDDREKRKKVQQHVLKQTLANIDAQQPDTDFKAKPFPKKLFDSSMDEKLQHEEEIRKLEAHMRANYLLTTSSLPPNMLKKRKSHSCFMSVKLPDNMTLDEKQRWDLEQSHRNCSHQHHYGNQRNRSYREIMTAEMEEELERYEQEAERRRREEEIEKALDRELEDEQSSYPSRMYRSSSRPITVY